MSKSLITDEEYRRFEDIMFELWFYIEHKESFSSKFTVKDIERINKVFKQLSAEHPREYKIIIRHRLKHVYYTTIAREQGVSEGYIRKLAKNGAYYFLQFYDKK